MAFIGNQGETLSKVLISNLKGKVDTTDDLPSTADTNDLYIVGEGLGYLRASDGAWIELGSIRGVPGVQGVPGPIGSIIQMDIVRNIDLDGNMWFPADLDWANKRGAAGTTDIYQITSSDGGTLEFKVYNGNDGSLAINDAHTSPTTVWSSDKLRKEILRNKPQLPTVVAGLIL